MLCQKPYRPSPGLEFACGLCLPCRINRRKEWTCRALLEASAHQVNSFLTLTLDDEHCPADGSLSKEPYQAFLSRWRFAFGPVRYMMVGEYGSRTRRPHFHALFFGQSPNPMQLREAWGNGHVDVGTLTMQSVSYVTGYLLKKRVGSTNTGPSSLMPEFLRASLKPGIGASALDMLERLHYEEFGAKYIAEHRDVMRMVRFGGRIFPIGRYLTRKLRERVGLPEKDPLRTERAFSEMKLVRSTPDLLERLEFKRINHGRKALQASADRRRKDVL